MKYIFLESSDNVIHEFFDRNQISEKSIMEEFYFFVLCSYLQKCCIHLADVVNRRAFLQKYRNSKVKKLLIRNFASNISGCQLSETETAWFEKCILANISKSSTRRTIEVSEKKKLLDKQENKCAVCHKDLSSISFHVDHIIPWELVGDELDGNLQVLCEDCNLSKSNSLNFHLHRLVRI